MSSSTVRAISLITALLLSACSGFTDSDECDPGEGRDCTTQCGPGTQRCQNDGTWGLCFPLEEPDCTPGDFGTCELRPGAPPGLWFCSDECRIGPCLQLCVPGETWECDARCGPGQSRCLDDGSWGPCYEFIIPECLPGDVELCHDGSGYRRCTDECYFGPCDDGPCHEGEIAECARCAAQVCLSDGSWTECSATNDTMCSPGELQDCDAPCGPGQRQCTDDCEWSPCMEIIPVDCHPGDRQVCPTTLYCGLAFRICNAACEWSDCIETGD